MRDTAQPIVYVVDDDASIRRALTRLLHSGGFEAIVFSTAEEFLSLRTEATVPACLVLDAQMPGLSGPELQEKLRDIQDHIPIVFITGHGTIPMSVRAMKLGAVDFLPKPLDVTAFFDAIQQAVERDITLRQGKEELSEIQKRLTALTPRQREVLELVVRGMLNKQIAHVLGTSEKTVKVHRAQMMKKMGVRSVAELARAASKAGLPQESTSAELHAGRFA